MYIVNTVFMTLFIYLFIAHNLKEELQKFEGQICKSKINAMFDFLSISILCTLDETCNILMACPQETCADIKRSAKVSVDTLAFLLIFCERQILQ